MTNAARSRTYLKTYACCCAGLLLIVGLINLLIDPLHFYHRPFWPGGFVKNQPFQNPGLAKNYPYDSVIIGTSHTENFRPAHINDALGWQTLRLSMSGSTAHEQWHILSKALETGQVRNVLWGIDFESFAAGAQVVRPGFPFHLYHERWDTPLKYLFSTDTLNYSWRSVRGKDRRDLATLGYWSDDFTFGKDRVLAAWQHMQAATDHASHAELHRLGHLDVDALRESIRGNLTTVVRENPQVRFCLFFPPYSVLAALNDFTISSTLHRDRIWFQHAVVRAVADFANCEVYDFQQAVEVTHSLDNYKDLTHYSGRINDFIVESIARGDYRVQSGTYAAQLVELERRIQHFVRQAVVPGSEYFRELQLEQTRFLGIESPSRTASAERLLVR